MLFHFLDNDLNLSICKSWVKYLDDKSLLQPYLVKYSKDSEWVELLLTFYPEVDYTYNIDELLVSCCKYGHLGIVRWLTNDGADAGINNHQPFRYACIHGHLETAEYLLDLINTDDEKKLCVRSDDNYALKWSANYGHFEMVKWLVSNGANIRDNNYEPFQYACRHGHLEIAKYLLSLIDTDEKKKLCIHSNNSHALKWSARYGHLEVVVWLVNNGGDIRVGYYQPFQYTCENGHLKTAKYLLDLIDTDEEKKLCVQSHGNYSLRWSAACGHFDIVKWLTSNGANIRANDYEAFRYACECGHLETAKHLLDLIDADEEKKLCVHSDNDYALRCSVDNGHFEVVKWLVNNGANIRIKDYQPFRYACESGHLETAEYLFNLINTDDEKKLCVRSDDNYALKWSASEDHFEIVKWLINNGVDIRSSNYEVIRSLREGEIKDYLLDQLTEEERLKIIDDLN